MDSDLPIRLVYHLYVPKHEFGDRMDIHYECLRHYSHIFDESIFVLSMDDPSDIKRIIKIENKILEIGFVKNVHFKVIENSREYREGITCKKEIGDKLSELDGLTFFAHSKGGSNISYGTDNNLYEWITSLYYFNFEFLEAVKFALCENFALASGFLKIENDDVLENKFHYTYSGSFFWINAKRTLHYLLSFYGGYKLPTLIDRFYAENFLGDLFWTPKAVSIGQTLNINDTDDYNNVDEHIRKIVEKDHYDSFIKFHNNIVNLVKNKNGQITYN